MPKFIFKLEGVLRQRKHIERQKQRELAARVQALTQAQTELEQLRDAAQKSNDELRQNHLTGSLDMSFLAAHRRFLLAMQRQATAIAQKIAAAQQQVDDARKVVVSITSAGRDLITETRRLRTAWFIQRLAELTPDERAAFERLVPVLRRWSEL